jgi:DNA-binding beta-propeller fold protein YncE
MASEGLAVDDTGNIYVVDQNTSNVRKISESGIINRVAGTSLSGFSGDGGGPLFAKLNAPTGVAIDKNGRLFIADQINNRIRCIGCKMPAGITNINTNKMRQIIISPNPTSSRFDVTLPSVLNEQVEYKIFDAMGKMLKQFVGQTNSQQSLELNAPSGLYYVQAIISSQVLTEKFVLE